MNANLPKRTAAEIAELLSVIVGIDGRFRCVSFPPGLRDGVPDEVWDAAVHIARERHERTQELP